MAELPPFRPLNTPPKQKKPKRYVPGVSDFPKPAKAPSVSPTETILSQSPLPLVTQKPTAAKVKTAVPVKVKPRVQQKTKVLPQSHPAQVSKAKPITSPSSPVVSPPSSPPVIKAKPLKPTSDKPAKTVASASSANTSAPQMTVAQQVQALLAPQYGVLNTQEAQREAALKQFSDGIIAQLQGAPGQVAGDYQAAQSAVNGYAQTAANGLAAANPNSQNQALLDAIGAPQAQKDALAAQNQNVFSGGGAVLYDTHGAIPASQMAQDQASALAYARSLPAIQGLASMQGMRQFQNQDALARQQLAAQAPDLSLKIQAAQQDAFYKQAALDQNAQALGVKTTQQQFTNNVTMAKLQMSVDKYNASQTVKASKIDATVSKGLNDGFAHNSSGAIVYSGGKPLSFNGSTVSKKLPSPEQLGRLVDQWRNGKVQNVNVQQPNPDQNGNPVYRSVSTQTGKLRFGQAYSRLRAMGLGDKKARQYLDTAYPRGEQGRGWLTNEERAALRRAGVSDRARLVQGHGVLTPAQVAALGASLPPGVQSSGGYVISPTF